MNEASITVIVSPRLGVRATALILALYQYGIGPAPKWLIGALFRFKAA